VRDNAEENKQMIKVGQKYIFNGPRDDPYNGEIVTVLPSTEKFQEIAASYLFAVSFDESGFKSFVLESELSEIG
jgi:hypothetical protein